ncbi:MAG: HypC/HybG/HupF family hydrogenase formation chaperone [Rhodococcus sp.]|nr:HypC/HybG/HupF family hydrogenase formation chaperone [Rhodococcus sp. (in: high G+C Gram-positive bacteria)]
MCLGIPGRGRELLDGYGGELALVDVEGAPRKVNIGMLDEGTVTAGDWVVIHMGFAVEKVDEQGARHARAGLELMGRGGHDGEVVDSDTGNGEVGT